MRIQLDTMDRITGPGDVRGDPPVPGAGEGLACVTIPRRARLRGGIEVERRRRVPLIGTVIITIHNPRVVSVSRVLFFHGRYK